MNKTARIRALSVSGLLAVIFGIVSCRLIYLQGDRPQRFPLAAFQAAVLNVEYTWP